MKLRRWACVPKMPDPGAANAALPLRFSFGFVGMVATGLVRSGVSLGGCGDEECGGRGRGRGNG